MKRGYQHINERVLELTARGLSTGVIAERLGITVYRVCQIRQEAEKRQEKHDRIAR